MFGSTVLDITIGLVFVYLLYSLLATTINEGIASFLGLRAAQLGQAIERMLNDNGSVNGSTLAKDFYEAPLIKYLAKYSEKPSSGWFKKIRGWFVRVTGKDKPSY